MKGKTIIELTDVNSGKVQRVEHHNVFQKTILSKLFKTMGSLGGSLLSSGSDQWKSLTGGILVFDDTIEEGTQYPPSSVNMTANGAYNVQNNTDPVELGTWNESESYTSADEIVMVWDWTTAQGNGRINSVCLTSATAGVAGLGNASQTRLPQGSCVQPYVGSANIPSLTGDNHRCTDGNYYYYLSKSGTTITVKKRWANISGIDLLKGATNTYEETYTLTLPSDYSSYSFSYEPYPVQITESKIAFILNRSSSITAVIVDVANRSVSNEITMPKIGAPIAVTGVYPLQVAQIHTDNDVTYVSIYDIDTAQWIEDFETNVGVDNCLKIGDRYYFRNSNAFWYTPNDNVLSPMNVRWLQGSYVATGSYLPTFDKIQYGNDYGGLGIAMSFPAMYLATINNLEDEIVKDNTKTMKITYVLSRR